MEPELSLKEQFRLVPYINPKTGEEIVIGSLEYNKLVKKYGEPNKIRSPTSKALIQVGKGAYITLKKEGYSDKELILGYKTTSTKELVTHDISIIDDMIVEIYKHATIYDKLTLCKTNKKFSTLCKHDRAIQIYKFNVHPKITNDRSIFMYYIIKNNKLYSYDITIHDAELNEIPLPVGIIPISVAARERALIVLTNDGLYGKGYNVFGQLGGNERIYDDFFKMEQPPGTIIQVGCNNYQTVVLTSEGIFTYGDEKKSARKNTYIKLKLNVNNIYFIQPLSKNNYRFATPDGLYIVDSGRMTKYFIDNIIFIYNWYILTTTGLYHIPAHDITTLNKVPIDNVKKITSSIRGLFVLTTDNKLYKQVRNNFEELGYQDVMDAHKDFIVTDQNIIVRDINAL